MDPVALGGLWLRARSGPVRDLVTGALTLPLPMRRIAPNIADDALFGGVDLAATLAAGRVVMGAGVLATPCVLTLTMAERAGAGLAARMAQALDGGAHALIALDEGAEADEVLAPAIRDRLALFLDLGDLIWSDAEHLAPDPAATKAARAMLPEVKVGAAAVEALVRLTAAMGVASMRAPLLALAAARVAAALAGRVAVGEDDLRLAAEMVLAHRGQVPETAPEEPPEPEPPEDAPPEDQPDTSADETEAEPEIPQDMLLEAIRTALPPDLLARLAAGRAARMAAGASGTGAEKKGNRRGRPLPSREGRLGDGSRIDLVATLRTAAPWQRLRAPVPGREGALRIRPGDIRVKKFKENSDRVLIFVVDASGSSAMARLAEAKGAVELLLAQAYARRDHVALVAFRGRAAELLLPPTRSLVQTKRRLAGLPGGGATPLPAGLRMALEVAELTRSKGMTPTLALLTDGRGNIALDGSANRGMAEEDMLRLARAIRGRGIPSLVIDTAMRPQPVLRTLSATLDGTYLPLPRADARRMAATLGAALDV